MESRELSKYLIVNAKNKIITIHKNISASDEESPRINPDSTIPITDPIPKVILARAII